MMMITTDGCSGLGPCGGNGGDEDLTMDMDDFLHILAEPGVPSLSHHEDLSSKNLKDESATDIGNHIKFQLQSGFQTLDGRHALESETINPARFYTSHNPEASDARVGDSVGSYDHVGIVAMDFDHVKPESLSQISSPMYVCPGSLKEWYYPCSRNQGEGMIGVMEPEIPSCSMTSSFTDGADDTGNLDISFLLVEDGGQFRPLEGKDDSKDASHCQFGKSGAFIENPKIDFYTSKDMTFVDADVSSQNLVYTEASFCHNSDNNTELGDHYSTMQFGVNADNTFFLDSQQCFFGEGISSELLPCNEVIAANNKNEIGDFQTEGSCSLSEISMIDYSDVMGLSFKSEAANCLSPISGNFSSSADDRHVDNKSSGIPFGLTQSAICKKKLATVEDGKIGEVVRSMMSCSDEMSTEIVNRKLSYRDESNHFVGEESMQSCSGVSSSMLSQKRFVYIKDRERDINVASVRAQVDGIVGKIPLGAHLKLNASEQYFSCVEESNINKQLSLLRKEIVN